MYYEALVGFSYNPTSFVSRSIRFFRLDWSKEAPSHCFMIAGKLCEELMVIEATNPKARIVPLNKLMTDVKQFELWSIENIDKKTKTAQIVEGMKSVTIDYGYLQLFGFIWVWLFNKFKITVGNPFHNGLTCAEFVFNTLDRLGYVDEKLMKMDCNDIAPDHILNSFKANKQCKKVAVYYPEKRLLEWL
jgi:hypothetical protein